MNHTYLLVQFIFILFIMQIAIKHEYINEMVSSDVPQLHNVRFGQLSLPLIFQAVFISQHMVILIEIALFRSYWVY